MRASLLQLHALRRFGLALAMVSTAGGCGGCGGGGKSGTDAGPGRDANLPDGSVVDAATDAEVEAPPDFVHFMGRFDRGSMLRFSFPGSAIFTTFTGTGIDVTLSDSGNNQWAVVIDGRAPTLLETAGALKVYTLASGLPSATHTLELHKRTENYVGVVEFHAFAPRGGTLVRSPPPWKRRIEFIGDSITCGYGVEGTNPCSFSNDTENEYLAYGAVTARRLNAAHTAVCYSGKGASRNYGGGTTETMPVVYDRTMGDLPTPVWDFTREIPDVVVINLGTNDFSGGVDPGQPYVTAMLGLVRKARMKYPQAFVVLAVGSMMSGTELTKAKAYLQSVVTMAADSKVSFVDLGEQQTADGIGCDYHPSIQTQSKMADKLVTHLRTVTGW